MARWNFLPSIVLLAAALGCAPVLAENKAQLRARCIEAIDASGALTPGAANSRSPRSSKSDGSFRVEHQRDEDWRPLAAGIFF